MSILETIVTQRKADVAIAQAAVPVERLMQQLDKYPVVPMGFMRRLQPSADGRTVVLAEVKRASPSKGDIAPGIDAALQGLKYARAGASAISCLTEPTWFKGTLDDMKSIRQALEGLPNRPALLRKDFIIDEYQIYEARAYGADSLLLIVASLTDEEIGSFLSKSRELSMEPLVEVANESEMERALKLGAKVIGINNRNLHTFSVDLETTKRLVVGATKESEKKDEDILFVALSGISSREDVRQFEEINVRAVLVGESLMRSSNPFNKIKELQGAPIVLVKICGIQDVPMAIATAEAGADFIGLVFAESRRKVTIEKGKEIVEAIKSWRKSKTCELLKINKQEKAESASEWYRERALELHKAVSVMCPLTVGVFANNDPEMVQQTLEEVGLDIVQLSGNETPESAKNITVTTWKALHVPANTADDPTESLEQKISSVTGVHSALLLDTQDASALGGTGRVFDWKVAQYLSQKHTFFLAGGLNPENVASAVQLSQPFAVDVSSGVEVDGLKDLDKIKRFIINAKS